MRIIRFFCVALAFEFLIVQAVAQITTNPASVHDPRSMQLIGLALEAMGGSAAWNSIHASDVQGSASVNTDSDVSSIHWVDTWQKGSQMRRSKSDRFGKLTNFTADSEESRAITTNGQQRKIKNKYDPVSQLVTHMPGAALTIALKDRYNVSIAPLPHREADADCIEIEREKRNLIGGGVQVTVCLDKTGHLPAFAYLSVANPLDPSRPLKERIEYSGFQTVRGLLVPSKVIVASPVGRKITYALSNVKLNPANPEIKVPGGQE